MVIKATNTVAWLGLLFCLLGVSLSGALIGLGVIGPVTLGGFSASIVAAVALVCFAGLDVSSSS
jgi:hypothetical protein